MALSPGTRLGPYEVVSAIGAGGMGEVYRARDTRLGRDVALKLLPSTLSADPDRLRRFEREAKTLAALNHPHIAQIYGIETMQDGGREIPAIAMEFVEGKTLERRRFEIPEALPIASQIADALEAAHDAGIVHRDLKPANIIVRDDGVVKVLDFGHCRAREQTLACQHLEQHDAEGPDVRASIGDAAFRLLRTHVGRGAEDHAGLGHGGRRNCQRVRIRAITFLAGRLRETEVQDFHHAVVADDDVGGFEVAVDDAGVMRGLERVGDLARDADGFADGKTARRG